MASANIFYGSIPKLGNSDNENEDAIELIRLPKKGSGFSVIRCAIADGATQASFSKLWAEMLVRNAINSGHMPAIKRLKALLDKTYLEWENEVNEKKLPWFAIEKAKRGAFSSLLWMSISTSHMSNSGTLRAVSVGDSELLLLRNGMLLKAFPLQTSCEFGSSPELLSSKLEKNRNVKFELWITKWDKGDEIILATDAIGKFLLSRFEIGDNPLEPIRKCLLDNNNSGGFFRDWISELRSNRIIKNDDSTT